MGRLEIEIEELYLEYQSGNMLTTKDFNAMLFAERKKLVFSDGKFIDVFYENKLQKGFFYKLGDLKIDVVYDKVHNKLLDIIAWNNSEDRVDFLKMPVEDEIVGAVGG